jgi:hypothetical protein
MLFSLFKFTLAQNSVRLFWKLLAFVSLLGPSETFLCSTFALQLKTVLLLDVLQLLMLSAGTLMSLEIITFPLNTFYCKQDTAYMLSIYLIICVHNFILVLLLCFRSIILCLVILLVEIGPFISSYKHFIFIIIIIIIIIIMCVCAVSVIGRFAVGTAH